MTALALVLFIVGWWRQHAFEMADVGPVVVCPIEAASIPTACRDLWGRHPQQQCGYLVI